MDARLFLFLLDSLLLDCAKSCNCDTQSFNPACIRELNVNIYSACLAGCTVSTVTEDRSRCPTGDCGPSFNGTVIVYSNCTCLQKNLKTILTEHKFDR